MIFFYFVALGAAIFLSAAVDGKVDPSNPDVVAGPVTASPELGSGAMKKSDLSLEDLRKRMWWSKCMTNIRVLFERHGGKAGLEKFPDSAF